MFFYNIELCVAIVTFAVKECEVLRENWQFPRLGVGML